MRQLQDTPVGSPKDVARSARDPDRTISVLIAEDHGVLRDGLQLILGAASDIEVVGTVADGAEAVRQAEQLDPDVLVTGILMPGMSGVETTRLVVQKNPRIGVVVLSMHVSPIIARRALEAGARGVLTRASNGDEVLRAVRAVAGGERFLGHGLAESLLESGIAPRGGDRLIETLTGTERNILQRVADGRTNAQIAEAMSLSQRTVESYRQRLMSKLDLDSVAALVKYAIRNGVVTLD
ncbi:MAG TPA: response regulator transcription factor [Burkholderiaceae bacterium]|nr:response regulator transcription factor [Burkholderiaceae bacterium]